MAKATKTTKKKTVKKPAKKTVKKATKKVVKKTAKKTNRKEDSKGKKTGRGSNKEFLDNQIKQGEVRNPKGYKKGQRNYSTIYKEVIIKIGEEQGKTPEEIENELVETGILLAMKGNDKFHKDVMDRVHGKAVETHKLEGAIDTNVAITGMVVK